MTIKPYMTIVTTMVFILLISLSASGQKKSNLTIELSANSLTELGLNDLKNNFLNQPSIKLNYNAKRFSFGIEGGLLEDKVTSLYDQYPAVFGMIADRNVRSDSWKSTYILAGPSFNLINKLGLRIGLGVKGGFNMLNKSPDYDITDQVSGLTYERFDKVTETTSKLLVKPSLDFNFFPRGGPIGINFSASYFNINEPQTANSFGLDFSQTTIPVAVSDPDQVRKILSRWEITDRIEEPKTNGLAFSAGISFKISGTKKKEPKTEPVIPEPKIEKPKKDKEIVADKPTRNNKREKKPKVEKEKTPKPEKIIAEVIETPKKDKPGKDKPDEGTPTTKSAEPEDPCDCIETAQGLMDGVEIKRLFADQPYQLTFIDPTIVAGAYSVCAPSIASHTPPKANDIPQTILPGNVEWAHVIMDNEPNSAIIETALSGACPDLITNIFDIPDVVECGALLGGITEPILDLIIPDTTSPNEAILINAEAKGDWILANNGWTSPTQTYELFTRWTPLEMVHSNHQGIPSDSINHTFFVGELTTHGHMKAEYWVWEAGAPVCRNIFDVYYSNDTTNTNIFAGENGEFEITQSDGSGYDIIPGVPFSGTGIVWVPAIASTISLEFQDIKCDATGRLVDGEILALVDPSAPVLPLQWALGAISSTVDYDHDQVQSMMEWADSNLVDQPFLGTSGPLTPLADPAINMPMVLNLDTINDSRIAITEMIFEPNKSKFNAVVALAAPAEWNATDMIGFKASGVPFHPTDIVSPPERIELVDTINIGNVNNDISFHFMTAAEPYDPLHQGCYIAWDDDGFSHFGLELEARFTRDWFTPLPDDGSKSKVSLIGMGTAWNDILLTGDWPKSTIENAHNMTIEVDEMNFDLSDSYNPIDIDFPAVYDTIGVDTTSLWRGFYAENIELGLPDSWDTYDSLTGPPIIGVNDMFIDDQGLTMYAYAYNVASFDSIMISDLSASIDTITVDWQLGSLTEAHIQGKIGLPASHPDSMMNPLLYDGFFLDSLAIALDTSFSLPGPISDQSVFGLTINPSGPIYSDMLKGIIELEPTSQITAYKQDTVKHFSMLLDGALKYIDKPLGSYFKVNMDIGFQGLGFQYNSSDTLGLHLSNPTWSFASPQKKANGFPININNITLNPLPKTAGQKYHGTLDFDVTFALGDTSSSISAGSSMGIEFEVVDSPSDKLKFKPVYHGFDLDSLGISANLAAATLAGYITIDSDDPMYGKRFTGGLSAYFKGPGIGATVNGMFGNTDYGHASKYRYWYVDVGVVFGSPIPFLPGAGFYGFSGGAYGNIAMSIVNTGPDTYTKNYIPTYNAWGFKAGATLGTIPLQDAFNADITIEAAFSGSGISTISFDGAFGTNAKISDRRLGKGKINGSVLSFYDFPNKHFFLGASATINSPPITTPSPISLALDINGLTSDWYFVCGKPDYDPSSPDLMNEVNLNFDSTGVGVNLYEYFMFGNSIPYPDGFTYKFRDKYHDVLGSYPGFGSNVGVGGVNSNSELGTGMALGIGFQFEKSGGAHISGKYHLGYELEAGAEVNLSYMRYAGSCAGHFPIGTNGWRAKGNLGLYAKAAARVDKIDGGSVVKTWTIADLRAGAWITGEFPNPHYAAGAIDGQAQIGPWVGKAHPLGHWKSTFPWLWYEHCNHYVDKYLLNVNIHKEFEVGDQCNNAADNTTPTFDQENATDDFEEILIQHVSPLQNFNYPETAPIAVRFEFVPGEIFHVSEQQGSGAIINRTFRLDFTRSLKRKTSGGSWVNEWTKYEVNDIGEYQFVRNVATAAPPVLAGITSGGVSPGGIGASPATALAGVSISGGSPATGIIGMAALPASFVSLAGGVSPPPPPPPPLLNTLSVNTYYRFTVNATMMEYDYNTETWSPAIKSDGTPLTDEVIKTFRTGPMEPWVGVSGSLSTY